MRPRRFPEKLSLWMSFLFLFAAVVQFNDPDPVAWIMIYGSSSLVSLFHWRKKPMIEPAAWVALIAVVPAFMLILGEQLYLIDVAGTFESWEMVNENAENVREAGGLILCAGWMVGVILDQFRRLR